MLGTVQSYVTDARTLILDKVQPYRYSDDDMINGLNLALAEGRRLRPDLFICGYGVDIPQYLAITGETVPIEAQFRLAFVYGIAAHVLLRDEEDVQDSRANSFLNRFQSILVGPRETPVQGGTPAAGKEAQ